MLTHNQEARIQTAIRQLMAAFPLTALTGDAGAAVLCSAIRYGHRPPFWQNLYVQRRIVAAIREMIINANNIVSVYPKTVISGSVAGGGQSALWTAPVAGTVVASNVSTGIANIKFSLIINGAVAGTVTGSTGQTKTISKVIPRGATVRLRNNSTFYGGGSAALNMKAVFTSNYNSFEL